MKPIPAEFRRNRLPLPGSTIGLACGINAYTPVSSMFPRQLEREFGWTKTAALASLLALPLMALPLVSGLLALSAMTGWLLVFYGLFLAMMIVGSATGPIAYARKIAASFQTYRDAALARAIALGSLSFGVMRDAFGNYGWAIVFARALLVLASTAFAVLGWHPRRNGVVTA